MIQRLFVYGTLAPGRDNHHMLADIQGIWEEARVTGTLLDEGWGAKVGCPGIVLDGHEDVKGFLLSSEQLAEHWSRLDEFEGEEYKRVLTIVKLEDNSNLAAYIYTLRRKC